MGPKRFWRQNFSLLLVKFNKLGFNAPLIFQKHCEKKLLMLLLENADSCQSRWGHHKLVTHYSVSTRKGYKVI